jgi:transcriptional regulator with XRE-family HTH domain
MTPFGVRLRQLRAERGISLKQMAEALGVSAAYLSALEHGRRGRPTHAMVVAICAHLNIIWTMPTSCTASPASRIRASPSTRPVSRRLRRSSPICWPSASASCRPSASSASSICSRARPRCSRGAGAAAIR